MFNKNVFTQTDVVADLIKDINEADYKAKMEALKGNQHKIDKNKNNKVDADDFKILRGEKKVNEDQVEEATSVKIPTSTGTKVLGHRYGNAAKTHRDSMADPFAVVKGPGQKDIEDLEKKKVKKEEIDPKKVTTDTLAGVVKGKTANPFAPKKVMIDVAGNVKEEAEQLDEKVISSELQTIQGNHVVNSQTHTHPDAKHGVSSDTLVHKGTISSKGGSNKKKFEIHNHPNHGLVFKTNHTDDEKQSIKKHLIYNKMAGKGTAMQEEVEELDEAGFDPLKHVKNPSPAVKAAAKDVKRSSYADRAALMKAGGVKDDRGPRGVTQEEAEQVDERELSKGETAEKERIVKGMKKSLAGFKSRYGERAKEVMYATATKQAKKD